MVIKVGERTDVYRSWDWQRSPMDKLYMVQWFSAYVDHMVNIGQTDPDFIFGLRITFLIKTLVKFLI